MALRYAMTSNYMRLSITTAFKCDSLGLLSRKSSLCNNRNYSFSKLQRVAERSVIRNICTGPAALRDAARPKYENTNPTNVQASKPIMYENWESVLQEGEVEQSEDADGDTPYVIYLGVLSSQIRHVKLFSLATSAMGLCMQPVIFMQTDTSAAATAVAFTMIGFFTYVTPFLINLVSKRYVCEIVFDPKTNSYTSTTYNFFLQKKQLTFQTAHVKVPDVPGPFTSFVVNTADGRCTPLFVAPNTFTRPRHYAKLMGYDKPINLHLEDNQSEDKKGK